MSDKIKYQVELRIPVFLQVIVSAEDEDEALEKAYKAAYLSEYADGTIGSPCRHLGVGLFPNNDAIELIEIKETNEHQ